MKIRGPFCRAVVLTLVVLFSLGGPPPASAQRTSDGSSRQSSAARALIFAPSAWMAAPVAQQLAARRELGRILESGDEMAIGAMWACTALSVRVPHDVAIVGFDGTGSGLDTHGEVALTSVVQPFAALASTALDLLADQVAGTLHRRRARAR